MIRLLARSSALMITFAVAILLARLVGSARPKPALFSMLFTNPDGSPCEMPWMFGVRPGKMTIDEALRILKQEPFTRAMDQSKSGSEFLFRGQGCTVSIGKDGDWIGINVGFGTSTSISEQLMQAASLGTTVSTFGPPDFIAVSSGGATTTFFGTRLQFYHYGTSEGLVSVDNKVKLIFVHNAPLTQYVLNADNFRAWRGFSLAARYIAN
jgi:hypothetical protein